ncbi:hypothetical protein ACFRA5_43365 [Streptomyces mirabilis]|uniref:hypothetical protein n=1 Tax=Streptomyces mirabilis TaxID=68239 RepID=UPI00369DCD00
MRSVQRWRRAWHDAGTEGLRSAGPVSQAERGQICGCDAPGPFATGRRKRISGTADPSAAKITAICGHRAASGRLSRPRSAMTRSGDTLLGGCP